MITTTKIVAAILAGVVGAIIGHVVAFACTEVICGDLLGLSGRAGNLVYAAGEGVFSTLAIVGILVAVGTCSRALLISVGYGAFVTFVVALPAIGVLIHTENLMLGVICANIGLLTGMFLAIFFKSELRALLERRRG